MNLERLLCDMRVICTHALSSGTQVNAIVKLRTLEKLNSQLPWQQQYITMILYLITL